MGTDSRRRLRAAFAFVLTFGMLAAAPLASADGRVALVVGNGDYAATARLPNPGNDAADVAAALGRLGFDVTTVRDADLLAMSQALRTFRRESAGADVALVFYAGHGLEMGGVNYLVPVDARLEWDTDVRFEAISLEDVLAATEGAGLRIVILDACRNNPLARSMRRTNPSRSVSRGSFGELNEAHLGDETLVAYSAEAGSIAADGTGRNSPYTAALLAHLEEPLELTALFRAVGRQVRQATGGQQRTHEYASLQGEHYLKGVLVGAAVATGAAVEAATAGARLEQENLFWESIRESRTPEDFEAYLQEFPSGTYRALAANRLAALRADPAVPPNRPAAADPPTIGRPTTPSASGPVEEGVSEAAPALSGLLRRGVSASRTDDNGWTDLHFAAALDLPDAVDRLATAGASVNARLKTDGRPLSPQLVRSLRELGLSLGNWTRDGETPLHLAAYRGGRKAAAALLGRGADVDATTTYGWTPLHYAAWNNAVGVVTLLLESGVDIHATTRELDLRGNRNYRTALQVALGNGSRQAARVLRARGAR